MKMIQKLFFHGVIVSMVLFGVQKIHASNEHRVGLGAAVGASWPVGTDDVTSGIDGVSFDWGFFVDIPLVSSFHISPSAMIYKLQVRDEWRSVTDIDLNFKFIVPISRLSIHAGILAGLSSGADLDPNVLSMHTGLLGGIGYNLISNLDVFAMATYKVLFHDLEKVGDIHTYAGLMFRL